MKTKTTPFSSSYLPTTSNTEYWLIQDILFSCLNFLFLTEDIEGRSEDKGLKQGRTEEKEGLREGKTRSAFWNSYNEAELL